MLTLVMAVGEAPTSGRQVNTWIDDIGNVFLRAFSSGDLQWIEWPGLGTFAFSRGSHEVRVWPDKRGGLDDAVFDAFTSLQSTILQGLGWQLTLHASGAIGSAGVIAFCGHSGSGKSTLAFAMQQQTGWQQFADDTLVLQPDRSLVLARRLPFAPRLRPASREHFADAGGRLPSSSEPQCANAALAAVFVLQRDAALSNPRVWRMSQARAFSEVLAHAQCFDAEDLANTRELIDDYLALAERVPIFALEYPPGFEQLPNLTSAVIEAVASIKGHS